MSLPKMFLLLTGCYAAYKLSNASSISIAEKVEKADEIIDAASEDSFPASDPPAWTGTTTTSTTH